MNTRIRWTIVIGALLLAAAVGVVAYNAGISQGIAQGIEQSGKVIAAPPGAVPYYYVGHRPWGFGFFFVPLFFVAFWLLAFRGFRGHHHRHACHYEPRDTQMKDA